MKAYTMYSEDLSQQANIGVDSFLNGLLREKVITKEQYDTYREYRLAVVPATFWGKLWNKLVPEEKDTLSLYLVKPIGTTFPTTNNNNTKE